MPQENRFRAAPQSGGAANVAAKRTLEAGPEMDRLLSGFPLLRELLHLLSDPSSPQALADRELGSESVMVRAGWRIWTRSRADSAEIEELLRVSGASSEL